MQIEIGQPAPGFTLYNTEKQPVTLSEQKGSNVLLLFFPLAFTSVCTAELCSVRDNFKLYESLQAVPIGISVDSLYTLKKFKEEQALNFDLLSDFNKEVSAAYGSLYGQWGFGMRGVSKRSAFIIDKNGVVQYAEVLENAGEQPDFAAIREKLAALTL
ncbi:redoxin domain-containing protein [Flavisolibacter nicotianae]|uniref:redoxin domain-containing protein n=1 Tax=Flavisolibacter nicotianae TaxID=2364882 RepID=UPI000EAE2672|nr:redoxin domain-containing protein [Flavisolibacter nicotianae]